MSPLPSDEIEEATDAALAEAVAESRVTCEWCGKRGKQPQREGRWSVKCGACAAKDARRRPRELLSPWMERLLALRKKTVFKRSKLLAASGDRSRLDLSPEHALALLEKYPVLYREAWAAPKSPASRFAAGGFEIGDGWFAHRGPHLGEAGQRHGPPRRPGQGEIRPLEGALREGSSVPRDPSLYAEMRAAIDEAGDESERTCEVCGEPGTHEERHRLVECPVRAVRSDSAR